MIPCAETCAKRPFFAENPQKTPILGEKDARIAELEAERDSLQREVWTLESACEAKDMENADLEAEIAKRDKGIERLKKRRGELQAQVNRLVDELGERQDATRLRAENIALARDLGECMAERDALREKIAAIAEVVA